MTENLIIGLAWFVPRRLAYWCAIRVMAHATTGKWGQTEAPALLAMDALNRWESAN